MQYFLNCNIDKIDYIQTETIKDRLSHSVYIETDQHRQKYLHANSHQHHSKKLSVVHSLVHRVISISPPDNLQSELNHV